ncbi:MAG TPA: hypothetical protein VIV88_14880 [Gemmatimonadales bacterium]|jgi:hypothetical protein
MADIRPMNFGEILDASLTIYRRHFGLFLKLAAVSLSIPVLLFVYLAARSLGSLMTQTPNLQAVLLLVPIFILYYVASLVLTAGTVRIISDSYLGRSPRLQDALALGISKIGSLFAVGLGKGIILFLVFVAIGIVVATLAALAKGLGTVAVLLLLLACGVGAWLAAFVACGYGVTTPVVVLEALGSSFDAFGRSWELTRDFKLKVLGLGLVAILLTNTIPSVVFQTIGSAVTPSLPALGITLTALGYLLPLVLAPVLAAVITLMYYDLRVRREAFDLQVLGRQLGIL